MLKDKKGNLYPEGKGMFFKVAGSSVTFFGCLEGVYGDSKKVFFSNVSASDDQFVYSNMEIVMGNLLSIDGDRFEEVNDAVDFKLVSSNDEVLCVGDTASVTDLNMIYDGVISDIGVDYVILKDVTCLEDVMLEGGGCAHVSTFKKVVVVYGKTFNVDGVHYCPVVK